MEKTQHHQVSRSSQTRLKTTKLTCKTPTQESLPKIFYLQMLMSWACTRAPWRTLKFPWHFAEPCYLVFASIHTQEVQDAACKAALSELTADPSSERLHSVSRWHHPSLQRVSHKSGARSTRDLLEKASANLHWLKRQLLFVRLQPQLPRTLAVPSLSCAAPLVNWPLRSWS